MKSADNYDDLNKILTEQFTQEIKDRFKKGKMKEYCSVCKHEQILTLDDNIPKCSKCGNEFKLDIKKQ